MTVHSTAKAFKRNAVRAMQDEKLQRALSHVRTNFIAKRQSAVDKLPEFEALRETARDIKDHSLAHLDLYLERYEAKVMEAGGHVHYARTAEEARAAIIEICRRLGAKTVTKGKSMIGEEIGLNEALENAGVKPVETDLGEYIIQLRGEI
ncbi:MAG: lactate utilization protein, partial [Hyphomicrobiales bacterium]|nr:lactate utilization protein [Hyphomicrobiales bacterium]